MNTHYDQFRQALADGFDALNRSTRNTGFWDDRDNTFVRARLGIRGENGWTDSDDRYTPFGIAGAWRAYRISGLGNAEKLEKASAGLSDRLQRVPVLDNAYYGVVWSLAEAAISLQHDHYLQRLNALVRATESEFRSSPNLNCNVGLFALSELVGRGYADSWLSKLVRDKARTVAEAVNARGIPATGDPRAAYHQRMMYTAWGLCGAASAVNEDSFATAAGRILQRVVNERMDDDGGIRWHGVLERSVRASWLPAVYPYGHRIYYECHQCFFAIAVHLFEKATGDSRFSDSKAKALAWIFGDNRWSMDLRKTAVPGLPTRCISKAGRVSLWRNRFKGCYEIGAYLWALANEVGHEKAGL